METTGNMAGTASPKDLEKELAKLKAELEERKASLPAHTIRPHQLLAIEELETRIRSLEDQLPPRNSSETKR